MQFYKLSDQWNPEQRDCAGLVRFAWREALRPHDRPWFQRMGENYDPVAPDLNFKYRHTTSWKTLSHRIRHLQSMQISPTANSPNLPTRKLSRCSTAEFVGRNREQAKPGDLLFFHQPWVQKFPFHVMIFIGEARVASEGAHDWVVYHTGASPDDEGTVKKVRLAVLDGHPEKRWRPVSTNPNFLGFYRLKILSYRTERGSAGSVRRNESVPPTISQSTRLFTILIYVRDRRCNFLDRRLASAQLRQKSRSFFRPSKPKLTANLSSRFRRIARSALLKSPFSGWTIADSTVSTSAFIA